MAENHRFATGVQVLERLEATLSLKAIYWVFASALGLLAILSGVEHLVHVLPHRLVADGSDPLSIAQSVVSSSGAPTAWIESTERYIHEHPDLVGWVALLMFVLAAAHLEMEKDGPSKAACTFWVCFAALAQTSNNPWVWLVLVIAGWCVYAWRKDAGRARSAASDVPLVLAGLFYLPLLAVRSRTQRDGE